MLTSIYTLIEFLLKRASSKNFQYRFLGVNAISMMPRSYLRQSFIALLSHILCLCNTLFFPFISFSLSLFILFHCSLAFSLPFTQIHISSLSSLPLLFQAIFSDLNHSPYSVSPHWYLSQPAAGQISSYPFLISILLTVPLQNPASLSLYLSHTHALSHTLSLKHLLSLTHSLFTQAIPNAIFLT